MFQREGLGERTKCGRCVLCLWDRKDEVAEAQQISLGSHKKRLEKSGDKSYLAPMAMVRNLIFI